MMRLFFIRVRESFQQCAYKYTFLNPRASNIDTRLGHALEEMAGNVAYKPAFDHEDDFFGNGDGVFADALKVEDGDDHVKEARGVGGYAVFAGFDGVVDLRFDFIGPADDGPGGFGIAGNECADGVPDHGFGDFDEAFEGGDVVDADVLADALGLESGVGGDIADALETGGGAHARDGEAEILAVGMDLGEDFMGDARDLEVEGVHFLLGVQDLAGKIGAAVDKRHDRGIDLPFGEVGHVDKVVTEPAEEAFDHRWLPSFRGKSPGVSVATGRAEVKKVGRGSPADKAGALQRSERCGGGVSCGEEQKRR